VSLPPDAAGMRQRTDDALLKEMLGESLSDRELAIVQWFRNGEGCASCASVKASGRQRPYISKEDIYYRRIRASVQNV